MKKKDKYRTLGNPSNTFFPSLLCPLFHQTFAHEGGDFVLQLPTDQSILKTSSKGKKKIKSQPRRQVVIERGVSLRTRPEWACCRLLAQLQVHQSYS